MEDVLIGGSWRPATATGSFKATNPATREELPREFPISGWADCDAALAAASEAARELRTVAGEKIAAFLAKYADVIEARADAIAAIANTETGLPIKPRLRDIELPRTMTQLRQAAAAAREGSWMQAVIDNKNNLRSYFAPLGPVVAIGPNNFPFAYNGVAGGDFAAAVAVGCPVIAKAHPLHPATSRALAECAVEALKDSGLPAATVQMLYHVGNDDGLRLVSDPRVGGTGFTGSRGAGMALKAAADRVGKPIYLEMSSLNPVVFLPGVLREKLDALVTDTADSGLAAAGQFCTSPNLLFLVDGDEAQKFVAGLTATYAARPATTLLSGGGLQHLDKGVQQLVGGGAKVLTGASPAEGAAFCYRNTVLQVSGSEFMANGEVLQQEAFGNATTVVLCANVDELHAALESLEGNLTGSIYSSATGEDDALYDSVAAILRFKVGRLMNDKMPTGVALSPAMNHGGPFPSTGHPVFTAVGIPRSLARFVVLQSFDAVRPQRLPAALQDKAPNAEIWRSIDGSWVRG